MTTKYGKDRPLTRLLQVTISRDAYILLGKLIQKRVEQDFAPSKATKSAVMEAAITALAITEGVATEAPPVSEPVSHLKPFEIVPVSHDA
jgi:hypothetical protein